MQTYSLHPDMKIIKIKASVLYEKTATNMSSERGKVWYFYCLEAI